MYFTLKIFSSKANIFDHLFLTGKHEAAEASIEKGVAEETLDCSVKYRMHRFDGVRASKVELVVVGQERWWPWIVVGVIVAPVPVVGVGSLDGFHFAVLHADEIVLNFEISLSKGPNSGWPLSSSSITTSCCTSSSTCCLSSSTCCTSCCTCYTSSSSTCCKRIFWYWVFLYCRNLIGPEHI